MLDNDLVASVGCDKRLFRWCASTVEVVGEWEHSAKLWSVAKLGTSKIIVGATVGEVMVQSHEAASRIFIRTVSNICEAAVICSSLAVATSQSRCGTPTPSLFAQRCPMMVGSTLQLCATGELSQDAPAQKCVFSTMLSAIACNSIWPYQKIELEMLRFSTTTQSSFLRGFISTSSRYLPSRPCADYEQKRAWCQSLCSTMIELQWAAMMDIVLSLPRRSRQMALSTNMSLLWLRPLLHLHFGVRS